MGRKTTLWIYQTTHWVDFTWTDMDMTMKSISPEKSQTVLEAARNIAIRTSCIETKIHNTQQNSQCKLCGERDGTVNCIISSKLAQKECTTRHKIDWKGDTLGIMPMIEF